MSCTLEAGTRTSRVHIRQYLLGEFRGIAVLVEAESKASALEKGETSYDGRRKPEGLTFPENM